MRAVEIAHTHAAKADRRDFGAVLSKLALWQSEHWSSPFLAAEVFRGQSAAYFARLKWGRHPLVATGQAGDDRNFGTADPKRLGEQLGDRLVGGAVGGRFGNADFELLAPVRAGRPIRAALIAA
jgi:hypothetical protein